MSNTSTGEVIAITPMEMVGQNQDIAKRTIVIEFLDGQYEVKQAFELVKDKAEQLKAVVGQRVTISWNLKSREWNDKWYSNAVAWKVEVLGTASMKQPEPFSPQSMPTHAQDTEDDFPL